MIYLADYINDNPKTTRIDKPVESLIQYQGRNTVLDITIDEQTPLMEVYRDQKNHVTLKPLNDNTKENKIEILIYWKLHMEKMEQMKQRN